MTVQLRAARRDDAAAMAALVDMAGEGLPSAMWAHQADFGQCALDVGRARAARDDGSFSWRNAIMADWRGATVGMLITQQIGDHPEAVTSDTPPLIRPLVRLENAAPGTTYVNVLAVFPQARRHGVASALMDRAEASPGANGMSLIVSDGNRAARDFYASRGYQEAARLPVVKGDWDTPNAHWILMTRS